MKILPLILFLLLGSFCFAQEYKKDERTKLQKEDSNNSYQADSKSSVDLLKALEVAGINIFKIPLPPFEKRLKFAITIDEYVRGEKVNAKKLEPTYKGDNTYFHFIQTDTATLTRYYDYIDEITIFTKEEDSISTLKIQINNTGLGGLKLIKKKDMLRQFYEWRYYGKNTLKLNEDIPMLVFASSWYDKNWNVQRFCGAPFDLSTDKVESAALLKNSPHYYVISYKLSEF